MCIEYVVLCMCLCVYRGVVMCRNVCRVYMYTCVGMCEDCVRA